MGPLHRASLIGPRPAESQEKAAAAAEGCHGNSRQLCSLGLELAEEVVGDGRERKSQRKGRSQRRLRREGEEEKKEGSSEGRFTERKMRDKRNREEGRRNKRTQMACITSCGP